jgi:hypothetical protein
MIKERNFKKMFKKELIEISKKNKYSINENENIITFGKFLYDGMGDGVYFGNFSATFDYAQNSYKIKSFINLDPVPEELVDDFKEYNQTVTYDNEMDALNYIIEFLGAAYHSSGGSIGSKEMKFKYDIEQLIKKGS